MGHMVAGTGTTSHDHLPFVLPLGDEPSSRHRCEAPSCEACFKCDHRHHYPAEASPPQRLHQRGWPPGARRSPPERVIPSSTSKSVSPASLSTLWACALPPSTVVATQAWSMHRGPAVFPLPLIPPRPVVFATEDQLAQM
ncbi:hypothetical protein FIBSPDRAFT_775511 [Athelia psychrophila]|uniref:Uncharacterized protein n=1 Tax=Athelia psychrophila TaxID=1759441 RepID=A0A166UUZ3_9AGAM|nr:hypothetical protein FIBSPDRAFT_775511 [Fibularhizoctonia sp. CBS 109695]